MIRPDCSPELLSTNTSAYTSRAIDKGPWAVSSYKHWQGVSCVTIDTEKKCTGMRQNRDAHAPKICIVSLTYGTSYQIIQNILLPLCIQIESHINWRRCSPALELNAPAWRESVYWRVVIFFASVFVMSFSCIEFQLFAVYRDIKYKLMRQFVCDHAPRARSVPGDGTWWGTLSHHIRDERDIGELGDTLVIYAMLLTLLTFC